MKDKQDLGNNQHGFAKGKICLTFYIEMAGFIDKGRTVDIPFLFWFGFFASFRSQLLHHLHPSGRGDGELRLWLVHNTHLCPFFLIHINNSLMLHTHKPKIEKVFAWICSREQGPEDVGRKRNKRYTCWNTLDEFIQVQALQTVSRTARNCFYDSLSTVLCKAYWIYLTG